MNTLFRITLIASLSAAPSCGSAGTTVVLSYCGGFDESAVKRVELELASGFSQVPPNLPESVSARLHGSNLIYTVGETAPSFPKYTFELAGTGTVALTARAFSSDQTQLGESVPTQVALDAHTTLTLPICACTEGACGN